MHLLCYIAHIRHWVRAMVLDTTLKALVFSMMPSSILANAKKKGFGAAGAERVLRWFRSVFSFSNHPVIATSSFFPTELSR